MKRQNEVLAAVLVLAGLVSSAHAGFLGNLLEVRSEWDGGVNAVRHVTVKDPGVELTNFTSQYDWNIDITDTTVRFDKLDWAFYLSAKFNGHRFVDYAGTIPAITDVHITSTDISGMNESRIVYDENSISVNYANLSFRGGEHLLLGVEFVPEPATLSLLALGAMPLVRRRR
jgi:hypothetical protein